MLTNSEVSILCLPVKKKLYQPLASLPVALKCTVSLKRSYVTVHVAIHVAVHVSNILDSQSLADSNTTLTLHAP